MNFYVTFGQQYRTKESHPKGGHADGWIRIIADSYTQARQIAFNEFGPQWSMLYSENTFKPEYFPLGEIRVIGGD